ncbi:hypothetical protein ScPMuIL_010991 [Solemya velum]
MESGSMFCVLILLISLCGDIHTIEDREYWRKIAQEDIQASLRLPKYTNVAKNVILFIGDGMDPATIAASRIYRGQLRGENGEENSLNFEKFPYVGFSKTYNTDRQTPDSAGTATALMCGVKSRFGVLGVDQKAIAGNCESSKGAEVDSIVHWSHAEGKSTGLVTTARITHATPAGGYAHSPERDWEGDQDVPEGADCKDIAYQLVHNNSFIKVLFGGGRRFFYKYNELDPETEEMDADHGRKDGRNLITDWEADKKSRGAKYMYAWKKEQFDAMDPANIDYALGLFEPSHMQYEKDRNKGPTGEPSLAEMTRKAIEILKKNDKGFFLMVEGARIDHGHHDNIAKLALQETLSMEDAVGEATRLTEEKDTLIIVTADHGHVFNIGGYPLRGNDILGIVKSTDEELTDDKLPYATLVYGNGPGYDWGNRTNFTDADAKRDGRLQKAAVPMEWETHGGHDVAIYARGPMAHLFHGVHEQNYIAHVMAYASCVGQNKDHCNNPHTEPCVGIGNNNYVSLIAIWFALSAFFLF